jgi:hypothetical protein
MGISTLIHGSESQVLKKKEVTSGYRNEIPVKNHEMYLA